MWKTTDLFFRFLQFHSSGEHRQLLRSHFIQSCLFPEEWGLCRQRGHLLGSQIRSSLPLPHFKGPREGLCAADQESCQHKQWCSNARPITAETYGEDPALTLLFVLSFCALDIAIVQCFGTLGILSSVPLNYNNAIQLTAKVDIVVFSFNGVLPICEGDLGAEVILVLLFCKLGRKIKGNPRAPWIREGITDIYGLFHFLRTRNPLRMIGGALPRMILLGAESNLKKKTNSEAWPSIP